MKNCMWTFAAFGFAGTTLFLLPPISKLLISIYNISENKTRKTHNTSRGGSKNSLKHWKTFAGEWKIYFWFDFFLRPINSLSWHHLEIFFTCHNNNLYSFSFLFLSKIFHCYAPERLESRDVLPRDLYPNLVDHVVWCVVKRHRSIQHFMSCDVCVYVFVFLCMSKFCEEPRKVTKDFEFSKKKREGLQAREWNFQFPRRRRRNFCCHTMRWGDMEVSKVSGLKQVKWRHEGFPTLIIWQMTNSLLIILCIFTVEWGLSSVEGKFCIQFWRFIW